MLEERENVRFSDSVLRIILREVSRRREGKFVVTCPRCGMRLPIEHVIAEISVEHTYTRVVVRCPNCGHEERIVKMLFFETR